MNSFIQGNRVCYVRREKRLVVGSGSEETKYIQYNSYFIRMKNNCIMRLMERMHCWIY